MLPHNFSNGKERSSGTYLFLRLAQNASIEVVEDLAEVSSGKGIRLRSIMVMHGRLGREFKSPNADAVAWRITEVAASIEGGQIHLVVRYYEPADGAVGYDSKISLIKSIANILP